MSFTPGPWNVVDNASGMISISTGVGGTVAAVGHDIGDNMANAHLIAAAPDLFAAIDSADTAFAVLNVQDLGGQARACIREAWPLVQSARAKARPDSGYADAVAEVQQHEIARMDAVVDELRDRLADIARVLSGCPGVEVGNSKIHYAYHVAEGACNDQA